MENKCKKCGRKKYSTYSECECEKSGYDSTSYNPLLDSTDYSSSNDSSSSSDSSSDSSSSVDFGGGDFGGGGSSGDW